MTINERAEEYVDKKHDDLCSRVERKAAYIDGAIGQKKIDMEKVYDFMYNFTLPNGVAPLYDYVGNVMEIMRKDD